MDVLIVKNRSMILTTVEQLEFRRKKVSDLSLENLKKAHTQGNLQDSTVKKIEKLLSVWLKSVIYYKKQNKNKRNKSVAYPVFVTLTLPAQQIHDDRVIKNQVLLPFIKELVRCHGVVNYFWKAELQKNFNIHFHLIVDQFVRIDLLKEMWHRHLSGLGYIERYQSKHGLQLPHNVDVKKLTNIQGVISYIVKYCCKIDEASYIFGAKWGCSDRLKNLSYPYQFYDSSLKFYVDKLIEAKKVNVYVTDYCTVFYFNESFNWKVDYNFIADLELNDYLYVYELIYELDRCNDKSNISNESVLDLVSEDPIQLHFDFVCEAFYSTDLHDNIKETR
jgi:hypothetical protein